MNIGLLSRWSGRLSGVVGLVSLAATAVGSVPGAGDPAPGIDGALFASIDDVRINANGQAAFTGVLQQGFGDVTADNDRGFWGPQASTGDLTVLAREGDVAPGTGGAAFGPYSSVSPKVFSSTVISSTGRVAFYGRLQQDLEQGVVIGNATGVWTNVGATGNLELVHRATDLAPGTIEPRVFYNLVPLGFTANNDLFLLGTTVPPVIAGPPQHYWRFGYFQYSPVTGDTTLIAHDGEYFDINDNPDIQEFKTVLYLGVHTFNAEGQFEFSLTFTDNTTGTFVAPPSAPPLLPGDYNGDGFVGQNDLALVLQFWGTVIADGQSPDPLWINATQTTASIIGQDELALVLQNWGNAAAIATELGTITAATGLTENQVLGLVPEPTAAALLVLGGLMLVRRH